MKSMSCLFTFLTYYGSIYGNEKFGDYERMKDIRLLQDYQRYTLETVIQCVMFCLLDINCTAVSYNGQHNDCFLNGQNPYDDLGIFYNDSAWNSYRYRRPCHPEWLLYNHHCYLVVTTQKTWLDAENSCQTLNGHLIDIQNADEQSFVFNAVQSAVVSSTRFWTGLNDRAVNEKYVYTNEASVTYTNYADGEPSLLAEVAPNTNIWEDENCIEVMTNGKWNDDFCTKTGVSVCKKQQYQ